MFHECFSCADGGSPVRAPKGSLGPVQEGGSCLLSPSWAVQQPLLMLPSQQLLSSPLEQGCCSSAPVCLRVSAAVSNLAGKVLTNPPCFGPESSECCLCLAGYEHAATCKQPHTSLSKLFRWSSMGTGTQGRSEIMPGRVPKTCSCGTVGTWFNDGFGSAG